MTREEVKINGYKIPVNGEPVAIIPFPVEPEPEPALRMPPTVWPPELRAWMEGVTALLNGNGAAIPPIPHNVQPPDLAVWVQHVTQLVGEL